MAPPVGRRVRRIRRYVPADWSWRRGVAAVLLAEAAALLLLLLILAVTGRELVLGFRAPDAVPAPGAAGAWTIPVAGVRATDLEANYGAPRTPTRRHRGLDIRAPAGTPVLAAIPGTIVRLDSSGAGGLTIHQRALDGRTVLYYAHLQRRAPDLRVGDLVRQGDVIAWVGDTGNARGIPHLHFAVYTVSDPNDVSDGRHRDPLPILAPPGTRP